MQTIYFSPAWFFGYDISLELFFAIITLIISLFAFHLFRVSGERPTKLFGIAFMTISISYFLQSLFNFLIVAKLSQDLCALIKVKDAALFETWGIFVQIIFMTAGLVLLTYMTLKTEKPQVFWLILSIALIGTLASRNVLYVFYLISALLLIFLCWHFFGNYTKRRQAKTLFVALAFLFLLIRDIQFVLSLDYEIFYVLGRLAELTAYLLLAVNFYLVRRR